MANDSADWTNTVTVYDQSGSPASLIGNPATNTIGASANWSRTASTLPFFNPGTTNSYTLWSLHMLADIGNITSTVIPSRVFFSLTDLVGGTGIAVWNLLWNGATTIGTTYSYDQVISFPSGYLLAAPGVAGNRLELGWNVDIPSNWSVGGNNNVAVQLLYN